MDELGDKRYPVPAQYPAYQRTVGAPRTGRRVSLYALLDSVFIGVALLLTLWLAFILLTGSLTLQWRSLTLLVLFWFVVSYLLLPRLHQIFALMYLPDYFIGRTKTQDGVLGDPVNLAFDGSQRDIHVAMQRAGWTLADPITLGSSWRIVVSSIFGRSYPKAPVSDLYLFGRPHDFAYQQEVAGSAKQRHHVRFWKVPQGWILPGGHHADWLAAGTFDRTVGLSIFTLQVTHKIDEDTDLERDYIVRTLRFADPAVSVRVIEDFSTAYHHRNGGGDRVRTDGDLPIVNVEGVHDRLLQAGALPREIIPEVAGRKRVTDHAVPPMSLIASGTLVVLHLIAIILFWYSFFSAGTRIADVGGWKGISTGVAVSAAIGLEFFLWVAMLARRRWARIGLMLFSIGLAANSLIDLEQHDGQPLLLLAQSMMAVLVVLIISGVSAREWVSKGSKDREITIAEPPRWQY
ncbi:MAG: LssY C-terminal domain-containing protein [Actinomycetaceae bacterium]|nr:LssY C-terminal domain-containing protein [Actinomycetaceae bacterium]